MTAPLLDLLRATGLTALVLSASVASAQVDPLAKPITDEEIRRMLPLLKAEAADLAESREELKVLLEAAVAHDEKNGSLLKDILDAKVDPLAWLKEHSGSALVPAGAVYQAECSRSWSRHVRRPAAVFDLGPDQREARQAVDAARTFYKAKGFQAHGRIEPYNWGFQAPDDSLAASVMELNHFFRHRECNGMGPGPTVVLAASPEKLGRPLAGVPVEISHGKALADQLRFNRVRPEEYQLFRLRLLLAREDAKNLEGLTQAAAKGEESAAAARVRRKLEATLARRRASAEAYRRHAAELEKYAGEGAVEAEAKRSL